MASPRIEYAVLPAGDGPGQDRCFTADGLVVVLDGASAIDPVANPDATEYVDTLGPFLVEQVIATTEVDLRNALAEAIRQTTEKLALVPGTAPSSTVSIVRWRDDKVDVLVLGDSPVIVQFADGSQKTIDQHSQEHIAPDLRRLYRERLASGRGYDEEHRAILAEIQRREAQVRNKSGGYYIAEGDIHAANAATHESFPNSAVDGLIVASDGARVSNIAALLEKSSSSLRAWLEEIQEWERSTDPGGAVVQRSKQHDDKTVAVIRRK